MQNFQGEFTENPILYLFHIVFTICLLIGLKRSFNSGKQRNLQIIHLSASRLMNNP